jgi:cell division septation protein DedD
MAVTVVLVVTFLTGVLVGRGVRAERASEQQAEVLDEAPASPPRATIVPQQGMDPTQAVPTVGAEERADSTAKADVPQPVEEPPVAVKRSSAQDSPSVSVGQVDAAKATPPQVTKPAPAPPPVARSTAAAPPPAPAPAPSKAAPAAAAAPPPVAAATDTVRDGYAVQVAAVNVRSEADSIAKRLSAKGYAAYVEDPKGTQKMFRVRVGTFKSRSDAQSVADKAEERREVQALGHPLSSTRLLSFALAVASGLLLAFSFPSIGNPVIAWVALAPLLVALHRAPPGRSFLLGLVTGLVYFTGTLYWITQVMAVYGGLATVVAVVINALLIAYLSLFPGAVRDGRQPRVARRWPARAAGRTVCVGGHRTWPNLHPHRLPVGPARVQPGDQHPGGATGRDFRRLRAVCPRCRRERVTGVRGDPAIDASHGTAHEKPAGELSPADADACTRRRHRHLGNVPCEGAAI